jgi:hypothetical protein
MVDSPNPAFPYVAHSPNHPTSTMIYGAPAAEQESNTLTTAVMASRFATEDSGQRRKDHHQQFVVQASCRMCSSAMTLSAAIAPR